MDRLQENQRRIASGTGGALGRLSGGVLLVGLGNPPVTRSQEARVLETSRQMLGTGAAGWISPTLNGQPRVKKPPLCYWMTAGAYTIGGVSEGVGRVPTVLLGWLTIGLTYGIARRLFDQRTALIACTALLGSYFFFRYTRLAETDPAAMFFLTAAVCFIHRSALSPNPVWPHLVALATAMVILSKGAPAIFVAVFLISYCAIERRWDIARRFMLSGAPITLLAIAAPWFVYVDHAAGAELFNTLTGGDHFEWPWRYIPELFAASAPWSVFWPLAIVQACRRWKSDPGLRFAVLWFLSILIPLCINGNKQNHYLVMLSPPLMLLIGHLLANVPSEMERSIRTLLVLTALALGAGTIGGLVTIPTIRGEMLPIDWIVAAAVGAATALMLSHFRQGLAAGLRTIIVAVAAFMPVIVGYWVPSADTLTDREIARQITQVFGSPRFVYTGSGTDLQLCFYLRKAIPFAGDTAELMSLSRPGTIAIAITPIGGALPALPAAFEYRMRIEDRGKALSLFVHLPPEPDSPVERPAPGAG